jgi:hypothetical protein
MHFIYKNICLTFNLIMTKVEASFSIHIIIPNQNVDGEQGKIK